MKKIYLDNNFMCHIINDGTMKQIQTNIFDNCCDDIIKLCRYIPENENYILPNSEILWGPFIQFTAPSSITNIIQQQYEIDEANHLEELGALIDEIYNEDLEVIG